MAKVQRLPYLGTAEPDVLFVEWRVATGAAVRRGDVIAVVETLKAAFDVEAEHDGAFARLLVASGDRVPVQAPIAIVAADGENVGDAEVARLLAAATSGEPAAPAATATASTAPEPFMAGSPAVQVAPAARRRAAELGIDPTRVTGTGAGGLVRVADVERAHAERERPATATPAAAPTPAAAVAGASGDGTVDPDFLALLARDRAAFARLQSDFKVALYRRHGARIGSDCRIADGAVLIARRLVLGDGAFFGPDTTIDVHVLHAGSLLHFGARCRVRCRRLQAGDNAFFTDDIEIGGGGAMEPEAELLVGSHGFVGEHVHLNPCRTLRLGDEVVVSRNAVVMTHSFGGSILQGYPVRFAPVAVGDGAQIGIGAVLFPGVEVGSGSILLSGSALVTSMPPGRMFGGVPAVDLKAAARRPDPDALRVLVADLLDEFARQLQLRGMAAALDDGGGSGGERRLLVTHDGRVHALRYHAGAAFTGPVGGALAEELRVAIDWPDAAWNALPDHLTGFDLGRIAVRGRQGPLADAWREFLRKRGVRLNPRAWAYRGGWL